MNFTLMLAVFILCFSMIWAQDIVFKAENATNKVEEISYKVLEDLRAACSPLDTCDSSKRNGSSTYSNCECDHLCGEYKDCCIDSQYRGKGRSVGEFCRAIGAGKGVYLFEKCSPQWDGQHEMKTYCEQRHNIGSDLDAEAPITDSSINITYRNSYCALCNGAKGPFQRWNAKFVCDTLGRSQPVNITQEYIKKNMAHSEDKSKLGVKLFSEAHNRELFHECITDYEIPESVRSITRSCRPNLVSNCDTKWKNQSILRLCESYMAVIYVESKAYRNPHCALCNFKSVDHFKCEQSIGGIASRSKGWGLPIPFSLLLDVNRTDVNGAVQTDICGENELYDPKFNKCRTLRCNGDGYVVKNRKCVPK